MKLVVEDAAGTRSTVAFSGDEISVGRAPEGNTVRLSDRNVSRRHARFVRQGASVFVEDLGSLVGTRVNGERIQGRRKLRTGDVVEIGDFDLAILSDAELADPGAPPPLPPATTPARPGDAARPPATEAPGRAPTRPATPRALPVRVDRSRTIRLAAIAGAVALALGLAAGYAAARLSAPPTASTAR